MINIVSLCKSQLRLIILAVLVTVLTLGGFPNSRLDAMASDCNYINDIEGEYQCGGQCVLKGDSGLEFLGVSGETDTIEFLRLDDQEIDPYSRYSYRYDPYAYENRENFYKVTIEGQPDFSEVEIGPLTGSTLQTATTEVSDSLFPVVEVYSFDADRYEGCKSRGFTKIVSNPTEEHFKSCVIHCRKADNGRYY
ncbi:MAG: hypothetical protein QNJ33_07790 [Crocosphaera sp.]|nr:hypothetical protein [Crocosphaera sp.]